MTNHRNKQNYRFRTYQFRDRCHLKGGVHQGCFPKIVSEYDQEIPQSQIADNPMAQIKHSNQLSHLHQDDCNTRMDMK